MFGCSGKRGSRSRRAFSDFSGRKRNKLSREIAREEVISPLLLRENVRDRIPRLARFLRGGERGEAGGEKARNHAREDVAGPRFLKAFVRAHDERPCAGEYRRRGPLPDDDVLCREELLDVVVLLQERPFARVRRQYRVAHGIPAQDFERVGVNDFRQGREHQGAHQGRRTRKNARPVADKKNIGGLHHPPYRARMRSGERALIAHATCSGAMTTTDSAPARKAAMPAKYGAPAYSSEPPTTSTRPVARPRGGRTAEGGVGKPRGFPDGGRGRGFMVVLYSYVHKSPSTRERPAGEARSRFLRVAQDLRPPKGGGERGEPPR